VERRAHDSQEQRRDYYNPLDQNKLNGMIDYVSGEAGYHDDILPRKCAAVPVNRR